MLVKKNVKQFFRVSIKIFLSARAVEDIFDFVQLLRKKILSQIFLKIFKTVNLKSDSFMTTLFSHYNEVMKIEITL